MTGDRGQVACEGMDLSDVIAIRPSGLFDAGTQLSFLAVATLIAAWPRLVRRAKPAPLEQLIAQSRPPWFSASLYVTRRVGQLLTVSATVWLVSLPLVAYRFHLVALAGLVLSAFLWLPVAVALFTALLTVLTAPLPLLPDLFGLCCNWTLAVMEFCTSRAAQLSWGHTWVAGPPWWWVCVIYAGLMLRQFGRLSVAPRW